MFRNTVHINITKLLNSLFQLKAALLPQRSKRLTPLRDAEWWMRVGLDKDVLEAKFIDRKIGK